MQQSWKDILDKYNALVEDLDERGRRRWAATEAMAIGYGGIAAVCAATGMSDRTVRSGIKELQEESPLSPGRQRRRGGGRKPLEVHQPDLTDAVERWLNQPNVEIPSRRCDGHARA